MRKKALSLALFCLCTARAFAGVFAVSVDDSNILLNPSASNFASANGFLLTTNISDTAFAGSWNGVTTISPSKNSIYDYAVIGDTDGDGLADKIDLSSAGLVKVNSSGVVSVATAGTDYYNPGGTDVAVADGGTGISSGTSGGIPYYSGTTTIASSGALAANAIVIGGGAGTTPSTTTTGSGVLTFIGTPSFANFNAMTTGDDAAGLGTANTFTAANTISTAGAASTPALNISGAPYAAGSATTNFPLFYINEAAATASTTLSTSGTSFGINKDSSSGNLMDLMQDGVSKFKVDATGVALFADGATATPSIAFSTSASTGFKYSAASGLILCASSAEIWRTAASSINMRNNGVYSWSSDSNPATTADLLLGRDTAATLQLGTDASSPVAQTLKGADARSGTDTDTAGGTMTLAAGRGTGTGLGGTLKLQTAAVTTTGTAAGTLTDRLTIASIGTVTVPSSGAASAPALTVSGVPYAAGSATTNFPLVYINEAAATASTTLSTSGTSFGINKDSSSGNLMDLLQDGTSQFKVTAAGAVTSTGVVVAANGASTAPAYGFANGVNHGVYSRANGFITFTKSGDGDLVEFSGSGLQMKSTMPIGWSSANIGGSNDLILAREGAATLQFGLDSATPVAQILKAADARSGTDTDTAGGSLTVAAGRQTGNAAGGPLILSTGLATTTGTSAGTLSAREYYYGGEKAMTSATATVLANIAFGSSKYVGGSVTATTHADDATNFQATTEHFTFSAVNKAGTVTTVMQATPSTSTTAASSGTLTTAWTVVANGASIDIKNAADSSLSETTLKVSYKLTLNSDGALTITP